MTLYELSQKDVVTLETGTRLGRVDDLRFCEKTARVTHIVIMGKLKFFGLLGRENDKDVLWSDIVTFGEDVILVHSPHTEQKKRDFVLEKETKRKNVDFTATKNA